MITNGQTTKRVPALSGRIHEHELLRAIATSQNVSPDLRLAAAERAMQVGALSPEMLMQIYKRWGIEFSDDNAADSYALARLVSKTAIDEVERAVAKQVEDPKFRDQPRL